MTAWTRERNNRGVVFHNLLLLCGVIQISRRPWRSLSSRKRTWKLCFHCRRSIMDSSARERVCGVYMNVCTSASQTRLIAKWDGVYIECTLCINGWYQLMSESNELTTFIPSFWHVHFPNPKTLWFFPLVATKRSRFCFPGRTALRFRSSLLNFHLRLSPRPRFKKIPLSFLCRWLS